MTKTTAPKTVKENPVQSVGIPLPRRCIMEIEIKSVGPGILQDRMPIDIIAEGDEAKLKKVKQQLLDPEKEKAKLIKRYDREGRFKEAQYRVDGKKAVYHPGRAFQRAIWDAAALVPGLDKKGKVMSSAITVMDDMVELRGAKPQMDVRIVKRPGSKPGSKVPVLCSRALSPEWSATLTVQYDPDVLGEDQVGALVARAGYDIGVGNFTPQKRGNFGMFTLIVGRTVR
jgi:hypothetical protein